MTCNRTEAPSRGLGLSLALLIGLLSGACGSSGLEHDELNETEEIGSVSQAAIGTNIGTWQDSSGLVKVTLRRCGWSSSSSAPAATCDVASDEVLVGGGAEIQYNESPGALLTGSYPVTSSNFTTWKAKSKDHIASYPHKLRAYALGLKLNGFSASETRDNMWIGWSQGDSSSTAWAAKEVPSGYILVGGGGRVSSGDQLLKFSSLTPGSATAWQVRSKDHGYVSPGTVRAYAIGIKPCPPGLGYCLTSKATWCEVQAPSGYVLASCDVSAGYAMTSIGGDSDPWPGHTGPGRLLTDMIPRDGTPPWSKIRSKDHVYPDEFFLIARAIGLRKN